MSLPRTALWMALATTIAACSTPAGSAQRTAVPVSTAAIPTETELGRYVWVLEEAVDARGKRIDALFPPRAQGQLRFDPAQRSVIGHYGCNGMGGSYVLDAAGVLSNGNAHGWMSTLIGCEVNAAESALSALFLKPAQLRLHGGTAPMLQLDRLDGSARTRWRGIPTLETQYGQAGELLYLEIAAQPVHCAPPLPPRSNCLHVREVPQEFDIFKRGVDPGTAWRPLDGIAGYVHDPRMHSLAVVRRFTLPASADRPAQTRYVLQSVTMSENIELAQ